MPTTKVKRKKKQDPRDLQLEDRPSTLHPSADGPSSKKEPQTMEELLAQTGYEIKGYKRGNEVSGKILSITPKEMVIDISGKSYGVVPSREMEAIADLVPQLHVGETVTATVVMPENEYGHVLLSLRKTSNEKRWYILTQALEKGTEIDVMGVESAKGGLLIDFSGIRGFIPASQLDQMSSGNPMQLRGRKLTVKVLELDRATNRFVVSQKAVTQKDLIASQQKAMGRIRPGDEFTATVTGIVPFGAFVQVSVPAVSEEEKEITIEGLIHISEIAWERVENPGDYLKVGQAVQVKVIGVDLESGKLNLSMKQLTTDPWVEASKKYAQEQVIKGRVTRTSHFGVFVQLEPGIEGLIHISKMPVDFAPKVGDTISATIETIDSEKRKISLSVLTKEIPIGYR